jgi:hypothetical protein
MKEQLAVGIQEILPVNSRKAQRECNSPSQKRAATVGIFPPPYILPEKRARCGRHGRNRQPQPTMDNGHTNPFPFLSLPYPTS